MVLGVWSRRIASSFEFLVSLDLLKFAPAQVRCREIMVLIMLAVFWASYFPPSEKGTQVLSLFMALFVSGFWIVKRTWMGKMRFVS
ncbi:hypothetical protein V8F20_007590 [Naviculisporaceae sp. PSN 640]